MVAVQYQALDLQWSLAWQNKRCGEIERKMIFFDTDMDFGLSALKQKLMNSTSMILLRMIEILQNFFGQWKKEPSLGSHSKANRRNEIVIPLFQRKVGFRDIKQGNWVLTSGFPLSFLPYRFLQNHSLSPHLCI